ncbi:hypothetical protein CLOBY_29770 [Clostridium saccharobutylicum]|uniref:DUF5685 family protein n=1 Tax=Clostridium saccharobutylicum TaxID=169679 RepID=UPI000983E415|nr:DUF5685 family protein [Clostridium saccharobutylicum]AQS10828.1 hypothetical protein CLOBY_29770 [Clostridium saccharobutylicum]MBC2436824.1 hypothetical protein [Clostridium saccharobutylicum]NSB88912.1 hypothetical protein [Clostridium saccharobutylicum]NYC31805.1 hypothetical protein [Clostridium saccharobutylicum]OOM17790.1 hypothetical protein CLSAB_13170 [Clostridium saccharobutylicum]
MFGYVTPLKGEMKVKDFARFKCYYCGLCCHIKNEFGNIPRVSLNYDMTFLGLLLDALNPDELTVTSHRCILHPTEKKTIIYNNKALSYAASINISLFYYKLIDDVNDDKDFKSKLGIVFLSPYKKKFSKSILDINTSIKHYLNELYILENNKSFNSIDEICDPFSKLVGTIFKDYPYELNDDSNDLRDTLYSLGYSLGKWIYLIDALDDLKSDIEKNKFNPLNFLYNKESLPYDKFIQYIKPKLEFTILNCGYNCKENLKKLDLKRNKDILYNIIELGLMDKYVKIIDSTKAQ